MATSRLDLTGQRFGKLVAKARGADQGGRTTWICECDCGQTTTVMTGRLNSKIRPTCSCGCLVAINTRKANTIHGMRRTPEYRSWRAMMTRCKNPRAKEYSFYGGAGIQVCERWSSFENFYSDMGPRPHGMSIDRYPNNDGDYEPGNCRWATSREQACNRISTEFVTLPIAELERALGFTRGLLFKRLGSGWDIITAITTPIQMQFSRPQRIDAPPNVKILREELIPLARNAGEGEIS